jgi:hypothetical protein
MKITFGLPQGTVIAPLLFNAYINDLLQINTKGTVRAFADDTSVTFTAESREELYQIANSEFITIKNWLDNNLLSLNLNKTTYIEIIDRNESLLETNLNITGITKSNHVKYLGIVIDNKLKWDEQISELTKKLEKQCINLFYYETS